MSAALTAEGAPVVTLTDTWSAAGGAWAGSNQSEWVSDNILHPDAASDNGAVLHSSIRPLETTSAPQGGLYDTFFYTFFSAPTFTLSTSNVLVGLETISFSITYATEGGTPIDDIGLTLNYNDAYTGLAPDSRVTGETVTIDTGPLFGNMDFTTFTYTWLVSELGASTGFSLSWNLDQHNSFAQIDLTQAATAVPEPATWAMCFGGVVLAFALIRRRCRC